MKQRCLILLCLLALSCTQDRDWDNPCDPGGIAKPTLTGLKAAALNDSTIELTWQDSDGEMGYKIERSIDDGPMQEVGSVSQDDTSFADAGLKTDHHYRYQVRAFAANGEETKTDTEFHHVFPAPSDLVLTQVSDSEIHLEWQDNSVFEAGFKIERKKGAQGSYVEIGRVGANTTHYTDNVNSDGAYTYRIKAYVQDQGSGYSNEVSLSPSIAGMVFIPAGSFRMGDAFNEGNSDERPVHTVTVDGFWMDQYEVSNTMYKQYDASHSSYNNAPEHPVERVSWWDAIRYCNWRSRREGLEACYSESTGACEFSRNGYRLPTEAEWEYAARGGLQGKRYPWGDDISHDNANYFGTGGRDQWSGTSPVGSFDPNGYGLYDMAGNVWEWCSDWYDSGYYSKSPENNPTSANTGTDRVLRGGSWTYNPVILRCASRFRNTPDYRFNTFGFRCARTP